MADPHRLKAVGVWRGWVHVCFLESIRSSNLCSEAIGGACESIGAGGLDHLVGGFFFIFFVFLNFTHKTFY